MAPQDVQLPALPEGVIALVPMRNVVLFPHALVPITVGRAKSIAAVQHAKNTGALLGIVLQRDERVDDPGREALWDVGTTAKVVQYVDSDEQLRHALCQGVGRFRIEALVEGYPFLAARVQFIEEPAEISTQAEALGLQLRKRASEIISLLPGAPAELAHTLQAVKSPSHLADVVASLLDTEISEKQMLLETANPEERLQKVLQMLSHRIEVLRLSQEIG
ncbi:MAG: LON peptidase substrate-binding domain-containing protein, partial [Polaromonas sp.]